MSSTRPLIPPHSRHNDSAQYIFHQTVRSALRTVQVIVRLWKYRLPLHLYLHRPLCRHLHRPHPSASIPNLCLVFVRSRCPLVRTQRPRSTSSQPLKRPLTWTWTAGTRQSLNSSDCRKLKRRNVSSQRACGDSAHPDRRRRTHREGNERKQRRRKKART